MNDLNMKLLKQHVAILQTRMESVNRLADSLAKDAELLEINMDDGAPESTEVQEITGEAQERARVAEAKLAKAVKDLLFVMAGGDPCKVCAKKCLMGEKDCQPVWSGEDGAQ